ncbi:MAG: hypothetical protein CL912_30255, partial [Deltaproteobacteria bacterium]|nr:hypothetical protein [Deltaproteobacteria bacterium]
MWVVAYAILPDRRTTILNIKIDRLLLWSNSGAVQMRILSHKRQHFSQYNSSVSNLHFRKHLIVSRVQQFDIKAIQSRSSPAQRISRRLKTPQLPKPQEFPEMLQLTRSRTYPDDGMDLDIETSVVKKKVRFGPFSTPPTGNTYSV